MRRANPDCLLVQMPYSGLVRPSPALGLLQAVLRRDGISAETVYADLEFAAATGLSLQNLVAAVPPHELLGDWTFSHLAFPDFAPDDALYLESVLSRNRPHIGGSPDLFRLRARELRRAAGRLLEDLVELIREKHPAIVGCSSTLQQHVPSLALLRRLRERLPGIVTVLGGANCEAAMGHATHRCFPWVDYVFSGEADAWITPLFRGILAHGREIPVEELPPCTLAPVHRRLGYPMEAAEMPRATLDALEGQPLPDYGDYFDALDRLPALKARLRPSLPLETSRGCWHDGGGGAGCTFCGLNGAGKRFRSMSPEAALRRILGLADRYGTDRIQIMDNVMDPAHIRELVPALQGNPGSPKLWYEVRTHLGTSDLLAFRAANIRWIWAGIESLDDRLLRHMAKGSTAIRNIRFLKACRQAGVFVGWNLMFDFPGDEEDWYAETARRMALLTHLQPPRAVMRLRFDRFSRYHGTSAAYGLDLRPAALHPFVYPLPEKDLADLACFFEDEDRRRLPRFADLLVRPGVRALVEAAASWSGRFRSEDPPVLTMSVENGRPHLIDTRAPRGDYQPGGAAGEILLACMDGLSIERLGSLLPRSPREIGEAIGELTESGLLLVIDGEALSLPLLEPVPALPGRNDYPGGCQVDPADP